MLLRLSRHASRDVRYIGTSATVACEGTRGERKQLVAGFAKNLFGAEVHPCNVIDETLVRVPQVDPPKTRAEHRTTPEEFAFGLNEDDEGRLVRHEPQTFKAAVEQLEQDSELPVEDCEREDSEPTLAFKLHQFLSSSSSVYATLEDIDSARFRWKRGTNWMTNDCCSPCRSATNADRTTI